jgi:hypothetical protein
VPLAQLAQLRALALQQREQVSVLRLVLAQPWVQEVLRLVLALVPPQQEQVQEQQHHSQPPRRQ